VIVLPGLRYARDLTVLNLAVPHLSADLAPSSAQLLWITDIYGFLVAGFLVTMGTLGDRIGRRLLLCGAAGPGWRSPCCVWSSPPARWPLSLWSPPPAGSAAGPARPRLAPTAAATIGLALMLSTSPSWPWSPSSRSSDPARCLADGHP